MVWATSGEAGIQIRRPETAKELLELVLEKREKP
jgi:hypothetical protein